MYSDSTCPLIDLAEFIPQVEDMLQYGCWFQILKERLAGKELPADAYDNQCRKWQRCNEVQYYCPL